MHIERVVCLLLGVLLLTLSVCSLRPYEENNSSSNNNNNNNNNSSSNKERNARRRNNNNHNHHKRQHPRQQQQQQQQQRKLQQLQQHQEQNASPSNTLLLTSDSDEFLYAEDYEFTSIEDAAVAAAGGGAAAANVADILPYSNDDAASSSASSSEHSTKALNAPYDIFTCCNEVFGSCRTACENLSLADLAVTEATSGRVPRMELKKYCPSMQLEFWSCMNRTLDAVSHGAQWSGRRCCTLGVLPQCRNVCATSASLAELNGICRRSDEQHMYACFERQEAGDRCCGNARTSECLQACRDVFETQSSINNNKNKNSNGKNNESGVDNHAQLTDACGTRNSDVLDCIHNVTDMAPLANAHKYLPCCEYASIEHCRSTCRTLLRGNVSSDLVFVRLESAGCGSPLPHLPLWQCFLTATRHLYVPAGSETSAEHSRAHSALRQQKGEISQLIQLGNDAAKLHCCEFAASAKCRRVCTQIFSTDWWQSRELFESACLEQPAELELRRCIESVDQPCELGCDGLSFCTNFNNRPTELFRSCNAATDVAAREDLKLLEQRGYVRVLGVDLHIKNTTRCAPTKWQALVCALHLRPCTRAGLYNNICREDCYELLNECMDWTRMHSYSNLNADAICARLQPGGLGGDIELPCVSLRPYLSQSDVPQASGGHHGLSAPCRRDACNASEVCLPLRNGSIRHECIPGCSLGETASYMVPFGAYVRVPVLGKTRSGGGGGGLPAMAEFMVCRCSVHGRIEHCQPLPSYTHAHCMLPGGRSIKHGESFYLECNLCSCFAGEITCTKQQCRLTGYSDAAYTSLPCNCAAHYVPVCGANGNTYQSACVAKCLGLQETEYEYGPCGTRNPCQTGDVVCGAGMQCIAQRKVCLSSMQRPCQQYQCVNQSSTDCQHPSIPETPACDNRGRTHTSACLLLASDAQFAYWGFCQSPTACNNKGPVCGINGVTYSNECTAWADYILVDYPARCREVGLLANDMGRRCETVKCDHLVSPYCRNIVPPGACCPICAGGAFRIIYSRKQLDRAMYALRGHHRDLLTLHGVLKELDTFVQINECQLTGFLTMEVGIFVALVPRGKPTRIQIEACGREAEKLSALISAQSPRITANLLLSSLTVSHMLDPSLYNSTAGIYNNTSYSGLILMAITVFSVIWRYLKFS